MAPFLSPATSPREQPSLSACRLIIAKRLQEYSLNDESCTFLQALLLSSVSHSKQPELSHLQEALSQRLLAQVTSTGSANYWIRGSLKSIERPYPDDWDTTACTLSALTLTQPSLLGGELLGKAILLLTAVEIEPGGPYKTWLVSPEASMTWKDVDLAVNANIAYFLSLQGVRLEKLDTWLIQSLTSGTLSSPYYPSGIHVLYFLSRALAGTPGIHPLAARAREQLPTSLLETAMLATTLLRAQAETDAQPYLTTLRAAVSDDAYLVADPVCIDSISQGSPSYLTSPYLTAAVCLEALSQATPPQQTSPLTAHDAQRDIMHHKVLAQIRTRFRELAPELSYAALRMLEKLMHTRTAQEITILPYDVAVAWKGTPLTLRQEQLIELCTAQVYGWLAYTIYDDFLDKEGDIHLLPVANTCLRQVIRILSTNLPCAIFQNTIHKTLDAMDGANAWEITHARLPLSHALPAYEDLTVLAHRSLGISLAPLAVIRHAGVEPQAAEVTHLHTFFVHFLTAKQLNDDLHDWEDDIARGHITAVVSRIFQKTGAPYTIQRLQEYQHIFWHEVILEMITELERHIHLAEQHVSLLPLTYPDLFNKLLEPLRLSATKVQQEHERSLHFLKAFQSSET